MLTISTEKFNTFTEIVTRWESGYDLPSPTVKSIRDRLLPLVAAIRGFCVTPEVAEATIPAVEPEDWRSGTPILDFGASGISDIPAAPIAKLSLTTGDDPPPEDPPEDPGEPEAPAPEGNIVVTPEEPVVEGTIIITDPGFVDPYEGGFP